MKDFLEKYLISEDAELHEVTGEWGLLRLLGPRTARCWERRWEPRFEPLAANATREASLAGTKVVLMGAPVFEKHEVDLLVPRGARWRRCGRRWWRPVGRTG